MEINILKIAHGTELMTLEERVKKAIANIDKALDETSSSELAKTLSMSGTDYLKQQRLLLVNLLESRSW